jgi:hypothetical protein
MTAAAGLEHELGFLLGRHVGRQTVAASAWAEATTAETESTAEVLLGGIAVEHRHLARRVNCDVFEVVNLFLRAAGGALLLYGFDTLGHPPEPAAVGVWEAEGLVFERTSERGSSRTVFAATSTGFRWSKSFRPPGGEHWQPVFDEVLDEVARA